MLLWWLRGAGLTETDLGETIRLARTARGEQLETLLYHRSREVLEAVLGNPHLREAHLMILLARKELGRETVALIVQNQEWMKSYPVKKAALKHPRLPRHLALRLLKFIYPFDLLEIALTPAVAPDLKRLIEDTLLSQCERLAIGQRLSLARRGSSRIAGGLLQDADSRVIRAALDNPSLTDQAVVSALLLETTSPELPGAVLEHTRWSARRTVRLATLRNRHLSLARFAALLTEATRSEWRDLAEDPRVAPPLRSYVANMLRNRSRGTGKTEV
jgi:hypothetical protein